MAEPETPEDGSEVEQSPQGGSKLSMIVVLLVGVVSAGAGFVVPMLFPSVVGAFTGNSKEEKKEEEPKLPEDVPQTFVPFGDIVVNLNEGRMNRYLRISITLQIDKEGKEEFEPMIKEKTALLKSWLFGYLSEKEMDEIRGAAGQNRLRREIQDNFNSLLFPDGNDKIHDILFEDFNVQ